MPFFIIIFCFPDYLLKYWAVGNFTFHPSPQERSEHLFTTKIEFRVYTQEMKFPKINIVVKSIYSSLISKSNLMKF